MAITHKAVWNALYKVAKQHGYSPSGLARRAGLDPTCFNKSKAFNPAGKKRWPSMGTIARVLRVVSMSFTDFAIMVEGKGRKG